MGRPKGSKNKPKVPVTTSTTTKPTKPVEPTDNSTDNIESTEADAMLVKLVTREHKTDAYCSICDEPIGTDYRIMGVVFNSLNNMPRNVYIHTKTDCMGIYLDWQRTREQRVTAS